MHSLAYLAHLALQVAHINGLTHEEAARYVGLVGDPPEIDDTGKVVVRDEHDTVLARLQWPDNT